VAPAKRGRSREAVILSRNKGGGFDLKVRDPSKAWQNTKMTVDVLETVLDPVAEALGAEGATGWTGERRLEALDVCLPLMEAALTPREGAARPTRDQRRQLIDLLLPLLREEVADQRGKLGGEQRRNVAPGGMARSKSTNCRWVRERIEPLVHFVGRAWAALMAGASQPFQRYDAPGNGSTP
jgi:hypothetical protein